MINNYSKNLYHALRNLPTEKEVVTSKGKGLLTPVKNFMRKKKAKNDQPAFIVKKSWNLLNDARNKINGNDD
tara:strand:+ start:330 stop:545 length:216 start_codon:yes stop_codon:yes gene_type:complete